jgi:hypothetical protein
MQAELTPMDGQKAIGITFTDKPVTAFGGLALFVPFAQRIRLAETLQSALPFVVTSPNATPPHQILLAFFAGVLAGARRFAQLALLRADSGFFEEAFLLALEAAQLPYIVAARFTNPLQAAVYRLAFRAFAPGLEVAELTYQALRWTTARRLIVVREELLRRPTARGRELFHAPGYRFHAVVTTLTCPPEEVWRTYNGRADTENRLTELKGAFGADGFCSQRFWATEAALRAICLLYNLVEAFQGALATPVRRTLTTLRVTVFACGAILGRVGRQPMLRLSRTPPWQHRFLAQLQRLLTWVLNCNAVAPAETIP